MLIMFVKHFCNLIQAKVQELVTLRNDFKVSPFGGGYDADIQSIVFLYDLIIRKTECDFLHGAVISVQFVQVKTTKSIFLTGKNNFIFFLFIRLFQCKVI